MPGRRTKATRWTAFVLAIAAVLAVSVAEATSTSAGGEACPDNCSGNGVCVAGACQCITGYGGAACQEKPVDLMRKMVRIVGDKDRKTKCPNDCSPPNGQCVNGECDCITGWFGLACDREACYNQCSGHGACQNEKCACFDDWSGIHCETMDCMNGCSDHGQCIGGACRCDDGFEGHDCSHQACPKECYGHGACMEGVCFCGEGYFGEDCSEGHCGSGCKNGGRCVRDTCKCNHPWHGAHCDLLLCADMECNGHGACGNGTCDCRRHWTGDGCEYEPCRDDCSHNGQCVRATCVCDHDFEGAYCESRRCPNDCYGNGKCIDEACSCDPGWEGALCDTRDPNWCPLGCSGHGTCVEGECFCENMYHGKSCAISIEGCANNCTGHGLCRNGLCQCMPYYGGKACDKDNKKDLPVEPKFWGKDKTGGHGYSCREEKCHGHGTCGPNMGEEGQVFDGSMCHCDGGWVGKTCRDLQCPNMCSEQGTCMLGMCLCNRPFYGADCSLRLTKNSLSLKGAHKEVCPVDCGRHGVCHKGTCECNEGFEGEICEKVSVVALADARCHKLNDCSKHGNCLGGVCFCHFGYQSADCSEANEDSCIKRCKRKCVDTKCAMSNDVPMVQHCASACHTTCSAYCNQLPTDQADTSVMDQGIAGVLDRVSSLETIIEDKISPNVENAAKLAAGAGAVPSGAVDESLDENEISLEENSPISPSPLRGVHHTFKRVYIGGEDHRQGATREKKREKMLQRARAKLARDKEYGLGAWMKDLDSEVKDIGNDLPGM